MPNPRKNRYKFKSKRRILFPILVIVLLFLNLLTSAQTQEHAESLPPSESKNDTLNSNGVIPVSKDKLEHPVSYQSKDSIVFDTKKKQLVLYNNAEIQYDEVKVKADFINYHQDSSILHALELKHEIKDSVQKPRLSQGQESSTFTSLQYNFKSKRALIENAYSQYGEGYILSEQVKRNIWVG